MLESEADAEFVYHVSAAALVCGQNVEIDFGARSEDEPAILGADGKVEADTIHVVDGFVKHKTGNGTNVPSVFVVFADVAEFYGKDDGVGGCCLFLDIVRGGSDVVASDA